MCNLCVAVLVACLEYLPRGIAAAEFSQDNLARAIWIHITFDNQMTTLLRVSFQFLLNLFMRARRGYCVQATDMNRPWHEHYTVTL